MRNYKFYIPSIPEQKEIVKLDKFSDHIKKLESTYNQKLLDLEISRNQFLTKPLKENYERSRY